VLLLLLDIFTIRLSRRKEKLIRDFH
jgi:hypothetical protein